ncbi:lysoplasmalogenase [Aquimarina aquimarini]|uniref:lysoplasmalogenase n=1 Tax=Aquimarina aquimarini TaxID=1191734 RepID=UPI000D5550C3|nr:lysoplasmalogenase [Aquimarina aquimarini]
MGVVLCDLLCSSIERLNDFRDFTKPLILVSLILFFLRNKNKLSAIVTRLLFFGLLFSLIGDVLLLFAVRAQLFFMMGLFAFLIAHIMYILIFLEKRNKQQKNTIFLMFTILYGIALFCLLYRGLGKLLIPVIIYMIVILLMSNASYLRKNSVSQVSYNQVFYGALFFMLSDSVLAYTEFCKPLFVQNIWIMISYAIAQLLIVKGILNQGKQVN